MGGGSHVDLLVSLRLSLKQEVLPAYTQRRASPVYPDLSPRSLFLASHKKYSFRPPLDGGTCRSSSLTALNNLNVGFMSSSMSHTDARFPHL